MRIWRFLLGAFFAGKKSQANVVRQNTFFFWQTQTNTSCCCGFHLEARKMNASFERTHETTATMFRAPVVCTGLHSPEEEGNSGARHMIVGQHPLQVVHVVVVGEYALHLPKAWLKLCRCRTCFGGRTGDERIVLRLHTEALQQRANR